MSDHRTDAPADTMYFCAPLSPTVVPAFERVIADLRRRSPQASDAQITEQFMFESVVLMDSRLPREALPC